MDTIELDPRLRHATTFLGRSPKMLIDGKMAGAVSGQTFEVVNPATGLVTANVPLALLGHRSMAASLHDSDRADRRRATAAAVHVLEDARKEPPRNGRLQNQRTVLQNGELKSR
jgi:acyl-CoA reductase-like NAD-dependent aldehyde dehydrogenase